jgi:phage repressor protein C with HTH and peptisase S24 domain
VNTGDRIKARLDAVGLSQAELARRVGITQPAINHLIKRGPGGSAHLHKIARELQTTPEYLSGETDDVSAEMLGDRRLAFHGADHQRDDPDTVMVDHIDLRFGLGGQYLDGPVDTVKRKFSRSWLRNFTDSPPELLSWTTAAGDSMAPTILDTDMILIDRGDREVEFGDKFWAIAYGQVGMIKRLRPMPDGGVKILSDNPLVPPETAYDDEMHVVGRVAAIVRKM